MLRAITTDCDDDRGDRAQHLYKNPSLSHEEANWECGEGDEL